MTTAVLSLDAGRMTLRCEDPALDESRVLDADATARFEGLAEDVGLDLAQLLLATGRKTEAVPILTRSRDGFVRPGKPEHATQIQALIDAAIKTP